MDYEFTLPWPPSINGYWRNFKGRQIISKRGRDFRARVIEHMQSIGLYDEKLSQQLSVSLNLNPPTLRSYDIDNFTKAVFDGLTHAHFWLDDSQVSELRITKGEKVKDGSVIVKVYTI